MVKLSDPNRKDFIELTSNILDYKPTSDSLTLESSPFFDPEIQFDSSLRNKIQKLSYSETLEVFFNEDKYDEFITYHHKQNKNSQKLSQLEIEGAFDFTLQSILCSGFPGESYYRSMEFYNNAVAKKKTNKRNNGVFWKLAFPSTSCYSYIKTNEKEYTVINAIWLNDALSHPVYKRVIDYYTGYVFEKAGSIERDSIGKVKNIFMEKLNSLILDIYNNPNEWTIKEDRRSSDLDRRYSNQYLHVEPKKKELEDTLKGIFKNIQDYKGNSFLTLDLNSDNIGRFMRMYENVRKTLDRYKNSQQSSERKKKLQEILLKQVNSIQTKHPEIYTITKEFLETDEMIKQFRISLKNLTRTITEKDVDQLLTQYSAPFKNKLKTHVEQLKDILFKEDMFEAVINNIDYHSTRTKEDAAEIEKRLKKEFPNYSSFLTSISNLNDSREITNRTWKMEAYKILGRGKDELVEKTNTKKKEIQFFDILANCNENNMSCHSSITPAAQDFLNVGLDSLKRDNSIKDDNKANTDTNNLTVYEAYVHLNVMEGKVTEDNFRKILCPYSNHRLGKFVSKPKNNAKKNSLVHDILFIPLNDEVEKMSDLNTKEKINKSKSNTTTQKQGGKRRPKSRKIRTTRKCRYYS
jgi:hypothetical protein